MTDLEVAERASDAGVTASALSTFFAGEPNRPGLVLGYAGFDEDTIRSSAMRLAKALGSPRK